MPDVCACYTTGRVRTQHSKAAEAQVTLPTLQSEPPTRCEWLPTLSSGPPTEWEWAADVVGGAADSVGMAPTTEGDGRMQHSPRRTLHSLSYRLASRQRGPLISAALGKHSVRSPLANAQSPNE